MYYEKANWQAFVAQLGLPCKFMHRDEFRTAYPAQQEALPAIFQCQGKQLHPCISAQQLLQCQNLAALQQLIREHCTKHTSE